MSHQGATGSRSEKILRFDLVDTYAAIPVLGEKHEVASVGIEKEAGDPRCGFGIGKVAKRCGRSAEIDREVGFCERLIDGGALVAGIEYVCDNGFAAVFVEDGIEQSALSSAFGQPIISLVWTCRTRLCGSNTSSSTTVQVPSPARVVFAMTCEPIAPAPIPTSLKSRSAAFPEIELREAAIDAIDDSPAMEFDR